jgi:hypothetical protein
VALRLRDFGFTHVWPLSGGFNRWLEDGTAPMERKLAQPKLVNQQDMVRKSK